jgi:hypothetical protein
MRIRKQTWAILLVLVAVVALVWVSGGMREGFTMPSVPSDSDLRSNTPAAQDFRNKLQTIAKSLGYPDAGHAEDLLGLFRTQYQNLPQNTTRDQFISTLSGGQTPTFSQVDNSDKPGVDTAYNYLFGNPGSSPTLPASSSTPSPASSSSTQPMTVGVPSPCRNSYKSIPGGSMEFKCFD